ncbi:hypothetical protein PG990_011285 [Apiospora arundinis]
MPASISQLILSSIKAYDSSQKAKASSTTTMPRTNFRMARLSKENSTQDVMARKDTPPGSPVAGVGTGTGTDGGSRTYSQYTLSRESSSIFMQSRLHQNYSRPLSASSCQQPQQQPTRIQQMLQSSRPSSRRNSSGNKPTVDSSSRPTPLPFDHANPDDKRTVDGDEKKTEEVVVEEEARREDHLEQQGEQQPPISTATAASPTRTPSPLLTLFPASETSSSSPIISSTSSGQQKAKRTTRLSPPLYLNETNLETMTTAEALAVFLDHPVLHTNQDFIEAVAWKEDDAWSGNSTSRSFIVVDEDAEVRKQQKSRNSVVAKKKKNKKQKMAEEDYELQH